MARDGSSATGEPDAGEADAMRDSLGLGFVPGLSVVVLTGAGISQESGIPTFRDPGGLWERFDIRAVATPNGFDEDPGLVWRFHSDLRRHVDSCRPNAGHLAIADLERRLGASFTLVTQNVDDLHRRAGSLRVLEVHGNVFRTRCSNVDCRLGTPVDDHSVYLDGAPRCPECRSALRPDVVWFGEYLNPVVEAAARSAIGRCDLFIAAGTSGSVWPAAGYVELARAAGARTVLVNLDPPDNVRAFDEFHRGKAAEILPSLLRDR
jgi:NAD-dependent deacetylase